MKEEKIILDALRKTKGPVNAEKIAESTGLDRETVDETFSELKKEFEKEFYKKYNFNKYILIALLIPLLLVLGTVLLCGLTEMGLINLNDILNTK